MNYELAKKLKEAGFPQDINISFDVGIDPKGEKAGIVFPWKSKEGKTGFFTRTDFCRTPSLSEIIESCGDRFHFLSKDKDTWRAVAGVKFAVTGKNPIEAVANLWLAINTK